MTKEDQIQVSYFDRLGFSCESDCCPISMDYVADHPSYVVHHQSSLTIGEFQTFHSLQTPPVFSVGVHVYNCKFQFHSTTLQQH